MLQTTSNAIRQQVMNHEGNTLICSELLKIPTTNRKFSPVSDHFQFFTERAQPVISPPHSARECQWRENLFHGVPPVVAGKRRATFVCLECYSVFPLWMLLDRVRTGHGKPGIS